MSFFDAYAAVRTLVADKKGVTAVEYGVVCTLIILAALVGIGLTGTNLNTLFTAIAGKLVAP